MICKFLWRDLYLVGELYFVQQKRPKNYENSKSQHLFHQWENQVEFFFFL